MNELPLEPWVDIDPDAEEYCYEQYLEDELANIFEDELDELEEIA